MFNQKGAVSLVLAVLVLLAIPVTVYFLNNSELIQKSINSLFAANSVNMTGLHVSGNKILNADNQEVQLLGVNRSGTEYACIQNWGIAEGPTDNASLQKIKDWGVNVIRVPLNEDCWLGINNPPTINYPNVSPTSSDAQYYGAAYRQYIQDYVQRINDTGMAVILELHWSAPGEFRAIKQQPMPDRSHTVEFWRQVSDTFKGNSSVVFDLFNEPYPYWNQESANAWECWRDGQKMLADGVTPDPNSCIGTEFWDNSGSQIACGLNSDGSAKKCEAAGMQELINTIRSTGANNIIMLGGLQYSNNLNKWLQYKPNDPQNQLAASWHVYDFNRCNNLNCWDTEVAPVAAQVPLIAGELGQTNCQQDFVNSLMDWLDAKSGHYLAWTWNTWGCSAPSIIENYDGTPNNLGLAFKNRFLSKVTTTPVPSATPVPTPGVVPMPLISKGLPAFNSSNVYQSWAAGDKANDLDFTTSWRSSGVPAWIAYDISSVPREKRSKVLAAYMCNGTNYVPPHYNCSNTYTLDVNTAPGGGQPPTSGWINKANITNNTYKSMQHYLDLSDGDYNWIRMNVTKSEGDPGNTDAGVVDLDLYDASKGITDSWIFYGDSITAESMVPDCFGKMINYILATGSNPGCSPYLKTPANLAYNLPVQENGGVGNWASWDFLSRIDTWLPLFPGKYVVIAYGMNDAGLSGDPNGYYNNLKTAVDKVLAAGKIPVIPKISWTNSEPYKSRIPAMNAAIDRLYSDYPQIIKGPDFWTLLNGRLDLMRSASDIHPNPTGMRFMNQAWADTMAREVYLASNPIPTTIPTTTPSGTPIPTVLPTPTIVPTPTPTPNPTPVAGTLLYSDNFESDTLDTIPQGWVSTDTNAGWSVKQSGGSKVYDHNGWTAKTTAGDSTWTDYSLSAKYKSNQWGSRKEGLIVRYKDSNNFYVIRDESNGLKLYRVKNGAWTQLGSVTTPFNTTNWYDFRVEVLGDTITVFVNGTQVMQVVDPTPLTSGKVGMWAEVSSQFDDVTVTAISAATPTPQATVAPTPTPLPAKKGDLNNDGIVNVIDLSYMLTKWNSSDTSADLNGDSKVNVIDLSIMLTNWGR